ncbi:protocatechuate 3,4-dioxygenase beta subunit [Pseudomonas duriflava]|uniref:Protocatechuate 3,4-dioxygenase beta subunit n=1 Tax=Pseudomonas duriflava TaxID=459528 RepID=A0A562QNP3_9PSED|nr:protocatechuate 3,4-dioxygenase subunit beta [Pseudomonas duriflava]TWI58315.1 protocatechuate 3,4-dioxygenase beta subunit [Pseudomonas duriflava]
MNNNSNDTRFVARDRSWHPQAYTPSYKSTVPRSPRQALVSIQQTVSERTGPDFSHLQFGKHDNDLLLNFNNGGLPQGERIILFGRIVDQFGKPVPNTLIEIWQANAGGRYRHKNDIYLAPLDPNFGGVGRTRTDSEGNYVFRTIKPGPYPWRNGANDWRPAHIHVSIMGPSISTRLITQLYFEGDPLLPICPIVKSIASPDAVQTLVARLDMTMANPMDCLAYRFDIVTRGARQTHFENL